MKSTHIIIGSCILILSILFIKSLANSAELKEGEYIVGPGTSVMIGRPPAGVKLNSMGCAQLAPAVYKCYAGMLAGQQFTSKQELIIAWRFIMNPPPENLESEIIKQQMLRR